MKINKVLCFFIGLFFLAIGLLVIPGCNEHTGLGISQRGSLVLNLSANVNKTLQPDIEMFVASYDIEGTGPSGSTFYLNDVDPNSGGITIEDLTIGSWVIIATAKNLNGTAIARGSAGAGVNYGMTATVE
ncbi:MAG: hypothetical protein KAT05_13560, partial [Spirochaetes bacterium]|nr:hypothetical protein [Spirochaetota bacterium]